MREIKFRIYTPTTKKIHYNRPEFVAEYFMDKIRPKKNKRCSDWILMQFTGLKDKNDKEIYEGDIVKVDNYLYVITVCKWDNGSFILEDKAGGHWTRQLFHQRDRLTVLGNIYENPGLIDKTT